MMLRKLASRKKVTAGEDALARPLRRAKSTKSQIASANGRMPVGMVSFAPTMARAAVARTPRRAAHSDLTRACSGRSQKVRFYKCSKEVCVAIPALGCEGNTIGYTCRHIKTTQIQGNVPVLCCCHLLISPRFAGSS